MIRIENEFVSLGFCEKTGRLESLVAKAAHKEFIKSPSLPFEVYSDFIRPYCFKDHMNPCAPEDVAAGTYSADSFALSSCGCGTKLVWKDKAGVEAALSVSLQGEEVTLSLTLTNTGREDAVLMPMFPYFGSLDLKAPEAKMLVMNNSGLVDDIWSVHGGPYGNAHFHSAQFGCFFEGEACMGYYVKDETFGAKDFRYFEPSFAINYFPEKTLAPGETLALPETVLLIYGGSWKRTAVAYGDWFRAEFNPPSPPAWIRETDAYNGVWAEKKGAPNQEKGNPELGMDTFDDLWEKYVELPINMFEYAYYCEGSAHPMLAPKDLHFTAGKPHTDGWNIPRADLGGMEALKRGVERIHKMGRRVSLYIEGLILPYNSVLYENKPGSKDWLLMNPDGTNNGPYTDYNFDHMCPGSEGWQDHVVEMATRLVREADVDGIRLDSYSFYFWPCYNPAHHHDSPFDHNKWMMEMFEKVSKALRAIKPDILLSTESPVDYNFLYFNHSLNQYFHDELYKLTNDTAPLRVAFPDYQVVQWNGGAVAQAMALMPDGYGRRYDIPADLTMSENLQCLRAAVRDTYVYGDVSSPNPTVLSGEGSEARVIRGEDEDLIFIARPTRSMEYVDSYRQLMIPLLPGKEKTTVSLPLNYRPAEALCYGIEKKSLSSIPFVYDGAAVKLTVESNFCAVVLRKKKKEAIALLEAPEAVKAGDTVSLRLTGACLCGVKEATLEINGLDGFESVPVSLSGETRVTIPGDAYPGRYIFTVTGEGMRPAVAIVKVEAK